MSTSRPRRAAAPVAQQPTPSRHTRAASSLEPHARSTRRQAASRKVSYADVTALSDPEDNGEAVKEEHMDVEEPEAEEEDQEEDVELPEEEEEAPAAAPRQRGRPKGKKGRKSGKGGARAREIKEVEREGTEMEGEEGEEVSCYADECLLLLTGRSLRVRSVLFTTDH